MAPTSRHITWQESDALTTALSSGGLVAANDARLGDARPALAHTHVHSHPEHAADVHVHPYADEDHTHPEGAHAHPEYAADGHGHAYSDVGHDHPHTHDYAATAHGHSYADPAHVHDYSATGHTHSYAALSHGHPQTDVTNLVTDLAGKAASVHTHVQGDVTGLSASLAGKSDTSHTHGGASITTLKKTADQANSTTTGANVTDLTFAVSALTDYAFHFYAVCSAAATTTGVQLAVNGPAGASLDATVVGWTSTTAIATTALVALETYQANTASQGNVRRVYEVYGVLRVGATPGTCALRVKSEIAASAVTVHKGSWGMVI